MPIVHDELRRLAHHYMRRERAGHSLQTTALVNEAYLRLVDYKRMHWQNRAHFVAAAAQAMRRILVDHARRYNLKRGAGAEHVSLDADAVMCPDRSDDFVSLDEAGVPTRTPVPDEPGEFISHVDLKVVGGFGKYAEATGTMTFDGRTHTGTVPRTVDLVYQGTVCGPNVKGSGN